MTSLLPHTPSATSKIDIGSISLSVTSFAGNGPRILLVHGIGSSGATWYPVIDRLAEHLSPITVDLRGHGLSDKPASGYHYNDYASDLDALVDALNLDPPLIMGHSLGGVVTLWWAMQHPDKARALIIEDSPLVSSLRFRPAFDAWILLNVMPYELLKRLYARENPEWPESVVQTRARLMKVTHRSVFTELRDTTLRRFHLDHSGHMKDIAAPVLYFHGDPETGSLVDPKHVATLPEHLPGVEIVQIPGGTHSMHRGQRDAFMDAVLRFLRHHGIIGADRATEAST